MSVDRRTFLKGAAVASVAAVAPAGIVAGSAARSTPAWHRTACTFCGVGCSLLVAVQDGRAVAAKGDTDSPVNRGLGCVKGYHAIQTLYGRDRITRPLVRRNGVLVETDLDTAWDAIAARLRETVARHGADAAGLYGSGQWSVVDAYIAAKLFKAGIGTNNIDTSVRLRHAAAATALASTYGLDGAPGCHEDIEHADVFVLWSHNMAETDPVLFSRLLERRRTHAGVRIIDVGTRTTRTSYAADRSLQYAPLAEIPLANAICHELVRRRAHNASFVARHVAFARATASAGDDDISGETSHPVDWAEYVRFLEQWSPDRVAALTGVAAEDIRWLASLYGDRTRRVLTTWDSELNRHHRGAWANNVLHNIHLLTGKVSSPGNGAFCCTGQPNGADSLHAAGASPDGLPGGSAHAAVDRGRAARVWGVAEERISTRRGRTATGLFRGIIDGSIRFLWVQAANPLVNLAGADRYQAALRSQDIFLVVTDAYPTATTAMADVVLPAALWLEREGVYGSSERRSQYVPRLVQAPGSARPDGWHTIEVARRAGYGELFPWNEAMYVTEAWREMERFESGLPGMAQLRAGSGILSPANGAEGTSWRFNPAHDAAADRRRGDFDFYGNADHRARIWLRPHEPPPESPDARFPLWLSTGAVLEHAGTGTLTRRIPVLQRAAPHAWVELNESDARDLGVRNGERVRVSTRRGAIDVQARIDHRTQPPVGQIFVPAFDEAVPIQRLMPDVVCPLSGQPASGKCAARVERIV
jgi:nitrate reductase (cytochrome)